MGKIEVAISASQFNLSGYSGPQSVSTGVKTTTITRGASKGLSFQQGTLKERGTPENPLFGGFNFTLSNLNAFPYLLCERREVQQRRIT